MSCLGPDYLPVPPRVWSRVENPCAYTNSDVIKNIPGDYIYLPYAVEPLLKSQYFYQLECLRKGNVLQYKKNSSNLTKQQIYAQIAKNKWVNRTTTWASQTESVSMPNTKSLKRVNYFNITTAGVPTAAPLTCSLPPPSINYSLPTIQTNLNPQSPVIPPPPLPDQPGGPIMPPGVQPAPEPASVVIPNSGNLVCNITQNICTGEIISVTSVGQCFPTTASDVPGTPMLLCYNDSLPTIYPKTRLTYPSAGGKWPEGAKLIAAAQTTQSGSKYNANANSLVTTAIETNNYNIYTIQSTSTADYNTKHIGIYLISVFNGENIILPEDRINVSFYTFFNSTDQEISIQSPNEIIYLFSEFFSSLSDSNNIILRAYQSITLTSIISSNDKQIMYFADFNAIISGEQRSNLTPVITYINMTSNRNYTISGTISDYYIINFSSSTGTIILPDNVKNFSIVKLYNLSTSTIVVSSSNLIYNTYYQPDGATTHYLEPYNRFSFQLVKTTNESVWISNSNNLQINHFSFDGPYYITNFIGDYRTSTNRIYIVESITGNIIIPSSTSNLSNIKIFNISNNSINIKCADNTTLLYNNFFALAPDGLTILSIPPNLAVTFQFINITDTQAQAQAKKKTGIVAQNSPFWTFTIC